MAIVRRDAARGLHAAIQPEQSSDADAGARSSPGSAAHHLRSGQPDLLTLAEAGTQGRADQSAGAIPTSGPRLVGARSRRSVAGHRNPGLGRKGLFLLCSDRSGAPAPAIRAEAGTWGAKPVSHDLLLRR